MSEPLFAAVDWGTSHFRLWLMGATGAVIAEGQGENGMSALKQCEFEAVLEDNLSALSVRPDLPVIICGMAGAAQGWHEVPYVNVPFPLDTLAHNAVRVPKTRRDIRILPGLAQRKVDAWDVMRGEETLLLGAVLEKGVEGTVCLPGTHSKWVRIEDGAVREFSTAMTGEIFGLLARNSTLAHFVDTSQQGFENSAAFANAVNEALRSPGRILRSLFSVRSMPLLIGEAVAGDMHDRLSGLLVGLEIAGIRQQHDNSVTLISTGRLTDIYSAAFDLASIRHEIIDANEMALAGLADAAKFLWPDRLMSPSALI